MNVRKIVTAGLVDSATASLATFVVGLYAVRFLDPRSLGGYSLLFSAWAALTMIPARLVFLPAEIDAAKRPQDQRLSAPLSSLAAGSFLSLLAGLAMIPVAYTVPAEVRREVVYPMTLTAVLCTIASPIQDHIRRMLHIDGRSWSAAIVSCIQLTAVAGVMVGMALAGVAPAWQPFGALAAANFMSGAAGLLVWMWHQTTKPVGLRPTTQSIRSGGWLLLGGVVPHLGGFGASWLVAHLASATVLGYAEAARILARPIGVLSVGLKAVFGPQLMRAGAALDRPTARHYERLYALTIIAIGGLWLVVAGFDVVWNPLAALMPSAYIVPGLVALTLLANIVDRVAGAGATLQLMGAGRERKLAAVETVGSFGQAVTGATAPITGAYAIPLGFFIGSAIKQSWLRALVRAHYREVTPQPAEAPPGVLVAQ